MTRNDFLIKWGVYVLALLPVWFLELYVLSRYPLFGVIPMLMPLAAVAVAVLEGAVGGAGYGLFVGVICDAVYFSSHGSMAIGLCLLGLMTGIIARYALRQSLAGCLVCSILALVLIDVFRVCFFLLRRVAPVTVLLRVAGLEILWSLAFVFPIYFLYRWVFQRVPKKTIL